MDGRKRDVKQQGHWSFEMSNNFTPTEMMTITASRALTNSDVCFVGIGAPSAACNLARLTHAPGITLIYESGTIGTCPDVLPLSIGDGELAATALTTVSVPEMFRYWLQGGRVTVGFLGGAQIDRFANINTTVIGPYENPKTRLPGGGGAPEIAVSCQKIFVTMKQSARSFVNEVDFVTSLGFGRTGKERAALGITTQGPAKVMTDLCVLEPEVGTNELIVTSLHPGVEREAVSSVTGWPVRFFPGLIINDPPTSEELTVLRELHERTAKAHGKAL
jgi:glutaconate CoA-transferase, subunit B